MSDLGAIIERERRAAKTRELALEVGYMLAWAAVFFVLGATAMAIWDGQIFR